MLRLQFFKLSFSGTTITILTRFTFSHGFALPGKNTDSLAIDTSPAAWFLTTRIVRLRSDPGKEERINP